MGRGGKERRKGALFVAFYSSGWVGWLVGWSLCRWRGGGGGGRREEVEGALLAV